MRRTKKTWRACRTSLGGSGDGGEEGRDRQGETGGARCANILGEAFITGGTAGRAVTTMGNFHGFHIAWSAKRKNGEGLQAVLDLHRP